MQPSHTSIPFLFLVVLCRHVYFSPLVLLTFTSLYKTNGLLQNPYVNTSSVMTDAKPTNLQWQRQPAFWKIEQPNFYHVTTLQVFFSRLLQQSWAETTPYCRETLRSSRQYPSRPFSFIDINSNQGTSLNMTPSLETTSFQSPTFFDFKQPPVEQHTLIYDILLRKVVSLL